METLAIITYKQPITKSEIEFIRGVSSDYSIQKLLEKELIVIAGRNEDAVGKPLIYATTKNFMDYLGVNSTTDLPKLNEIANSDIVFPTKGEDALPEAHLNGKLMVDDNGELRLEVAATETPNDTTGQTDETTAESADDTTAENAADNEESNENTEDEEGENDIEELGV